MAPAENVAAAAIEAALLTHPDGSPDQASEGRTEIAISIDNRRILPNIVTICVMMYAIQRLSQQRNLVPDVCHWFR